MGLTFYDLAREHFGFLEGQYGFKQTFENSALVRYAFGGMLEYTSASTVLVVDSEMGDASAWFYGRCDGKKYYLTPVAIHEYLHTSEPEKQLLLSTDPADGPAASALFKCTFLLDAQEWKNRGQGSLDELDRRLRNYAGWLKEHAALCLQGDFSRWPEFYAYKIHRARQSTCGARRMRFATRS